jgi:serine/threonine protein kinase
MQAWREDGREIVTGRQGTPAAPIPGVMSLVPGDRLGDYRIERVLDGGERWELCVAAHVLLPRTVTIRVARTPEEGVRLLREACMVEALAHAGIPRLYECGLYAPRRPWIATEQVTGRALAAGDVMAPGAVAALIRDVAAVLDHAHRRGIVHRALGPDAIVLADATRGWPICVGDWSEARTLDASPAPPRFGPYDAPELAGDVAPAVAVDVFALGAIAFEALTGALPFDDDADQPLIGDEILHHLGRRGPVPAAVEPLARLIEHMVAVDATARPAAAEVGRIAAQVAAELERDRSESVALAHAMLAVEEISLTVDDDPEEPEIEITRGAVGVGVEDAGSLKLTERMAVVPPPVALGGTPLARIRRPRWTPSFARIDSEHTTQVAGEIVIDLDDKSS